MALPLSCVAFERRRQQKRSPLAQIFATSRQRQRKIAHILCTRIYYIFKYIHLNVYMYLKKYK